MQLATSATGNYQNCKNSMPIQITCPGCLSRFAVSDKYAGKKGPCPKCKKEILIPEKSAEFKIHSPEVSGPKDSKGVSVLKPIERKEFKVAKWLWAVWGLGLVIVLGIAIGVRVSDSPPPTAILVLGALVTAPALVILGYTFLRDDELGGYEGQEYWIRVGICSAIYAGTWLLYFGLAQFFDHPVLAEISTVEMIIYIVAMLGIGATAAIMIFELETFQGVMHYLIYFAITFILCMIMGIEMGEPLATELPTGLPRQIGR